MASTYRDKLIIKPDVGTPEHDEICFSINKEKALEFLKVVCPDVPKGICATQHMYFDGFEIDCPLCSKKHYIIGEFNYEGNTYGPGCSKYRLSYNKMDGSFWNGGKFSDTQKYVTPPSNPCRTELMNQISIKHAKDILNLKALFDASNSFTLDDIRNIEFEHPCLSYSSYPIGIIDSIVTVKRTDCSYRILLLIEVKPEIVSFGDTLRQMKVYLEYIKGDYDSRVIPIIYYRRCKNKQIIDALIGQGITPIQQIVETNPTLPIVKDAGPEQTVLGKE